MPKKKYRAVNRIVGLTKDPLEINDMVQLEDEVAAPFVKTGSLAPEGHKLPDPQPESAAQPSAEPPDDE